MEHVARMFNRQNLVAEVVTVDRSSRGGSHSHIVDWRGKVCTCGKWSIYGIPCSHTQVMARRLNLDLSNFVRTYYNVTTYKMTYKGVFHSLMSEKYWEDPDFELFHNDRLRTATPVERSRSMCIPNEMNLPQARVGQQGQAIRNEHN